jgi:UDP-N-acetylglucosamine 1-carboxyvinyltransferase
LLTRILILFIPLFVHAQTPCAGLLSPKIFKSSDTQALPRLSADRAKDAKLIVNGGQKLSGVVRVDPAKNAYLPILAATLLNSNPVRLKDVPELRDMETFLAIFKSMGVKVSQEGAYTVIDASTMHTNIATCDLVKTVRASILILGPMLSRFQGGMVGLPGGCPIGSRPIDIHLKYLRELGARIDEQPEHVLADVEPRLKGTVLNLPFPSVGATQNLVMAAVLAEGETTITNAAREPEIDDHIEFLNRMGADIRNDGQGTILIRGVHSLKSGVEYRAIGDRIEAATYIIGALLTDSELRVEGFMPAHIQSVLDVLTKMGARLEVGLDYVQVRRGPTLRAVDVVTAPHPGFPTDVQAQLMALMTQAQGISTIRETIFEQRFQHATQMNTLGANITIDGDRAMVQGPTPALTGATVKCTDLRGGAALILMALKATGPTELHDIYYVERGYSRFLEKFAGMGACQMQPLR